MATDRKKTEYHIIFSHNMHFIMSIQNKKQDDITKALNVSHSTVSSWCSGVRMPRMERLKVLADYFDVDPELLTRPHKDLSDFIDDMNKRKESGSSDASKIEYEVEEGNDLTFIKNHFNRMVYYSLYFNAASSGENISPELEDKVRERFHDIIGNAVYDELSVEDKSAIQPPKVQLNGATQAEIYGFKAAELARFVSEHTDYLHIFNAIRCLSRDELKALVNGSQRLAQLVGEQMMDSIL